MKIKKLINFSIEYIRKVTISGSSYRYSLFYGFLALIMILLKQIFSLVFYTSDEINNLNNYIWIFIVITLLIISFSIIYIKKLKENNIFYKLFLSSFPYIFIALGIVISNLYTDKLDIILSMTVIIFMVTWIQIFPLLKRILIYFYLMSFYYLYEIIIYGIDSFSFSKSNFVMMLTLISFITSSILYQIYLHNKNIIKNLNQKNRSINKVVNDLEITHKDLVESKKITYALFEMTQEVLKNEKIENIMQLILEKAISFIPNGQAGSILILNKDKMRFVASVGYKLENLQKIELHPDELYQSNFKDKYKPEIIKNLEVFDEVHIGKEKTLRLKEESDNIAKSCLTCSFKYDGEFFGSINIDNFDDEDIFTDKDKYLMKQFSSEIEIIVSIHKLYDQALRPTKYDDLTNAKTRKYSIELLENLVNRKVKSVISICMVDINDLKRVNDSYGHDIGDKFLAYYSETILNLDIRKNIFGRIGGDEFIIIFDKTNKDETLEEIEKIKNHFKKNPFKFNEITIEVSFSAGVSEFPFDSENIGELIKLSDRRMYNNKNKQKHLI